MQLHFEDRDSWRRWLEDNHGDVREVWLVFFKKHTGKRSISYDAAVEEALCFGWIDSLIRRLDDDRYARKFTPRTDSRRWSAANLRRVRALVASGRMTDAGLAKVPEDVEAEPPVSSRTLEVPPFMAEALAAHPAAERFFMHLPPSSRRDYIHWISSAKRPETRARRLDEAIALLLERRRLGMK